MDRKFLLLIAAAIPLGLAGGYGWAAWTAQPPKLHPPKPAIADLPASPEEYPAALDVDWANRGDDASADPATPALANKSTKACDADACEVPAE